MNVRVSENGLVAPGMIRVFQIQYADRFDFTVVESGQPDRVFDCSLWSEIVPLNGEVHVQRTDSDGDIEYVVHNRDGKGVITRTTSEYVVFPPPMQIADL